MPKIIATYNSHQSNTQPAPLCPTSKRESARKSLRSRTLGDPMDCSSTRLLCPWDSPGENTGVGSHFLPRGSSPPRARTWVSHIAGGLFTDWATRKLALSQEQVRLHVIFESEGQASLLLAPAALQPAKGAPLPCVGSHDWGTQYVAWTVHSPGQVSTCVISLFFWLSSQRHRSQLDRLSSLLSQFMSIFITVSVVQESFCQFLVHFQWELLNM